MEGFLDRYPLEEVFGEFLSINTQNPPGNEKPAVDYLVDRIREVDKEHRMHYQIISHSEHRASVVFRMEGAEKNTGLAFWGHLDTVPAGESAQWKYPAITGTYVEPDWIYGRGATDMKSGDVAILMVMEYLLTERIVPKRTLFFVFTADEEVGCVGSGSVRDSELLKQVTEYIVAEPTDNRIGISEKGTLWIALEAHGRQAHGALPETGINAIEQIYRWIDVLKGKYPPDRISISTTMLQGGFKENIIPGYAKAVLDIRTEDEEIHEQVQKDIAELELLFREKNGVDIRHKLLQERIPLIMEKDSAMVSKMADCIRKMSGKAEYIRIPFYTDLAVLFRYHKSPFLILGPGEADGLHVANEKVKLSAIRQAVRIYLNYIL